jgi:NAD+ synthase
VKQKIIRWIRERVRQAGTRGIVMGISGGLDSSVVAVLAKEAVGKKKFLALIIPCHSQAGDLEDARFLTKKFAIPAKTVDLTEIYDNLIKIFPAASKLARNNLKPRLRMLTLYYFANKLNYLVCGTGNKSELAVGYFTKYGDGGADILPIGGLLKKQVITLAKDLGIPERIITKPPTAGLWDGQTDEKEMGITYLELDDILERMGNKDRQVLGKGKINKVRKMMRASAHKRQGPKICYI